MNILYTITSYPPSVGGAQLHLHEIAKRVSRKHHVKVISFFDRNRNDWLLGTTIRVPNNEVKYKYDGVEVTNLSFSRKEKLRMFPYVCSYYFNKENCINHISKTIERKMASIAGKFDLIHNIRVGREPISYASYNLAKKLNVPFLFTPNHHPKWNHWYFKEYQQLYAKADGVFALTSYEKELYKKWNIDDRKIFVTGVGPILAAHAQPEAFRTKYNLAGDIVLFLGQGFKYKGIWELIKAAELVLNRKQNISFVFIGPHTKFSKKIFSNQRTEGISHLGPVDLQTKTDALAACSILCLPSKQESFGGVFTEAWMFEKPVIGSNIPQIKCIVRDGINGLLTDPAPTKIAGKIIFLLDNPKLAGKLGRAGKEMVESNYCWDILYEKTLSAYGRILNNFTN